MKVLKTPEEVADFINHLPNAGDVDVSGFLLEDEPWLRVTVRSTNEEYEYSLETVKMAKEQYLIDDRD